MPIHDVSQDGGDLVKDLRWLVHTSIPVVSPENIVSDESTSTSA